MISIFIPVFNEQEIIRDTLQTVVGRARALGQPFEILVVDNGSTDRTEEITNELVGEFSELRYFRLSERGPGRAFIKAVHEARFENIITLDADLSSDLVFLNYAADLLSHASMVVGSKTLGRERRSLTRVFGSNLYILCAQLFFDLTITDFSIGCKAYRRSDILRVIDQIDTWTGYTFELCLYLQSQGKKVVQVGIDCDDQRPSHFSLLHEGYYRFLHLYRTRRALRRGESWIPQSLTSKQSLVKELR